MRHNKVSLAVIFFGSILFSSCEEGFFEKALYNVYIVNNTSDHLNIYESEKGGAFYKIGEVDANSTAKEKAFIIEQEYKLEARKDDGTVVETNTFNQDDEADITWTID